MGKYAVYSFCKLGFFVYLLYFAKVLSRSTRKSIIDVMRNDKEVCKVPEFLDENEITKCCLELKYPQANGTADDWPPNTALCLLFYDTWYKACNSNQLQNVANSSASFTSFIKKFYPGNTVDDMMTFCQNFYELNISHATLKSLLYKKLNPFMCSEICFKGEKRLFNPICAMLVWSVSIDNNNKKSVPPGGKTNESAENKGAKPSGGMESQIDKMLPEKSSSNLNTKNDSPTISSPQNTAQKAFNLTSTETKPVVPVQVEPVKVEKQKSTSNVPNQQSETLTSTGTAHASSPKVSKAENSNESATNHNKNDKATTSSNNNNNNNNNRNKNDQKQTNDIKTEVNSKTKDTVSGGNGDTSANDGVKQPVKIVNNDVKTSTISEDTQDHDISANPDNWNGVIDDKPYEPNDTPDQPLELAGDQNPINPEPVERARITHYHSLKSDEESHFFTYFTVVSLISIVAYIGYHNKQKILAIVLEGRKSRSSRGRRRPSTANYRKLDCTLEEAVTSQCNANVTHVIY